MPPPSARSEQLLIITAVLATCVLFTRTAFDPVNVLKLTALLLTAIAVVTVAAVTDVRDRVLRLPSGAAGAAAGGLAAAFCLSAVAAPVTGVAVLGTNGRHSGLLAYLAALVLFAVSLRVFHGRDGRLLVGGIGLAGLFTAAYGLLQRAGIDAVPWNNPFNPIIAALGNPNFTSGYLGVAAAVAAGGAAYTGWSRGWRLAFGVLAALCLLTAVLTRSVQGPLAAAAGLLVLVLCLSLDLRSSLRRGALALLGLTAATALGVVVVGAISRAGPAAGLFTDVGSEARRHYWGAALTMLREHPVVGVGLDQYGHRWWSARSATAVQDLGGGQFSDAAHSVPLQMLAQGGALLGLAYAAFVLVVLISLCRGLVRLRGEQRRLLGALGAGWAAYQVQSAVSIDQVPLLVLHFVLAGAVVAASGTARTREVRLPGALPTPDAEPVRRRGRPRATAPRRRALTSADQAMMAGVVLVGLVAAWFSLLPLRASAALKTGAEAVAVGDVPAGLAAYRRAVDLAPRQSLPLIKRAELLQQASPPQPDRALSALLQARTLNPFEPNTVRVAARLAEDLGQLDLARQLHQQAVEIDPRNPETLAGAATFELRHTGAARARRLMEPAVRDLPGSALLWATLGDARAVLADAAGARAAYERALALQPDQPTALAGLQKLAADGA